MFSDRFWTFAVESASFFECSSLCLQSCFSGFDLNVVIMVRLCERANETYAVTNLNIRDLLLIEGRKLLGGAGQAIDNLFARLDKRR